MIMLLYSLLEIIAAVAFFLCAITVVWYLLSTKKQSFEVWSEQYKKNVSGLRGNIAKPFLIVALIATLITSTAIHQLVGIHNLQLKPDGVYCFYVEATRFSKKSYTLPAQVKVETESLEVSEGKEEKRTNYYIERVFFPNGGYLDIEDSDPVKIGGSCYYHDMDTDDEWAFVLLNEHAYSPYVTESNNASWLNIILLAAKLLSISFTQYVLSHKVKSDNQQKVSAYL